MCLSSDSHDNKTACGIVYVVTNLINGKKYVGATRRTLAIRKQEHRKPSQLKFKDSFQEALKKYGIDNFEWKIYCYCDPEKIDLMEQEIIKMLDTYNSGYNMTIGGKGTKGHRNHRKYTDEERQILREKMIGNTYAKGKSHAVSEETRKKLSISLRGRVWSDELRDILLPHLRQLNESRKGIPLPEETRKKMSQSMMGNDNGKYKIMPITINGITYPSRKQAAKSLGLTYHAFYSRLTRGYYGDPKIYIGRKAEIESNNKDCN